MVAYIGAAFIILCFSQLLMTFGLVEQAGSIIAISRQASVALSDKALDDDAKEKAMQQHSIALFSGFFRLTLGLIAALGIPVLLVWLLSLMKLWSFDDVMIASISWPMIVGGVVVFMLMMMRARRGVQK